MTLTFIDETTDLEALLSPYTQLTTIKEIAKAEDDIYTEESEAFITQACQIIAENYGLHRIDGTNVRHDLKIKHCDTLASFFGVNGFWQYSGSLGLSESCEDVILHLHNSYHQRISDRNVRHLCKDMNMYDSYLMNL